MFIPGQIVKVREGYDLYPATVIKIGKTGKVIVSVDRGGKAFMKSSDRASYDPKDVVALDTPMCIVSWYKRKGAPAPSHRIDTTEFPQFHVKASEHPRQGRYVTQKCDNGEFTDEWIITGNDQRFWNF